MSIVTINLNNRDFKLLCPTEDQPELVLLAEKLDLEISKIKQANPTASFELLLVMIALNLLHNEQKKITLEGAEALKEANEDFQATLSLIFEELKIVAEKFENC